MPIANCRLLEARRYVRLARHAPQLAVPDLDVALALELETTLGALVLASRLHELAPRARLRLGFIALLPPRLPRAAVAEIQGQVIERVTDSPHASNKPRLQGSPLPA